MKICHLIYDDIRNPWLGGGGALRAREIYRRLAGRHEITLVTGRFPGAALEEEEEGLRFVRVGTERSYARSRLGYCRGAVGCLRRLKWDVWVHEFSAFAPLWAPRKLRRAGILFFYHFVGRHALKKHPLAGGAAWMAEELTLRGYRRIVTISPSIQARVKAKLGRRAAQVACVYTGVDARYFGLEAVEEPYVLYLGRTDVHTKGMDVLVRAFARLAPDYPALRLKVAGRGRPEAVRVFEELVREVGMAARVDRLGGVNEVQKGELLRRALFVCAPSRYEGWCMVAVEAAAAGKAVLGTRIEGLRDAVREGETGLLVEAGAVEALEQGMRRLVAEAPLRRALGEKGRAWARHFDWERVARAQEELLLEAAAGGGPG